VCERRNEVHLKRRSLISLESAYAVTAGKFGGQTILFLGSEGRGGSTLTLRGPDWTPSKIADGPGGNMAIIPMPHVSGTPRVLLIIDGFFPIFQSEGAGASRYTEAPDSSETWIRSRLFDLPFLHRMDLVFPAGKPTIIAAALCGKKDFRDDWSSAGAVYAVDIRDDGSQCQVGKPILGGITKNHGMFLRHKKEGEEVFVSGEEGVFSIRVPKVGEEWHSEKILDTATGDVVLHDLDGDGQEEILAIQPFHGDTACVYKKAGREWQPVWRAPLDFGHVAWAGEIRGHKSIILGSRAGKKELSLYVLKDPSRWEFDRVVLDEGKGAANIAVVNEAGRDLVFASNVAVGEVALYEII
jgi:hypothetical protein